jgi:hypothetical protein
MPLDYAKPERRRLTDASVLVLWLLVFGVLGVAMVGCTLLPWFSR